MADRKIHWMRWSAPDAKGIQRWFTPCGYEVRTVGFNDPLRIATWRKNVTCKRCRKAIRSTPTEAPNA